MCECVAGERGCERNSECHAGARAEPIDRHHELLRGAPSRPAREVRSAVPAGGNGRQEARGRPATAYRATGAQMKASNVSTMSGRTVESGHPGAWSGRRFSLAYGGDCATLASHTGAPYWAGSSGGATRQHHPLARLVRLGMRSLSWPLCPSESSPDEPPAAGSGAATPQSAEAPAFSRNSAPNV
jgi:hypothetical protein